MHAARPLALALAFMLSWHAASAQDLSRYRAYALESSVDTVVAAMGTRTEPAKTLHERPALIQQLEWSAPYVLSDSTQADPVRAIDFRFYNDALYQVVVTYDRDRTEGLTSTDVIESLSAAYGTATLASARTRIAVPTAGLADSTVLARWESAASSVTLVRGAYPPEFQLILISKPLSARAREAIREGVRLNAIDAPRRQSALLKKEASEATAARDKTRLTNKAAFRP
jgi:hypothetical protein